MKTVACFLLALAACGGSETSDDTPDAPVAPRCMPSPGAAAETVMTTSGVVRGAIAGSTFAYKRVPYAAAPTGERRFAPPEPASCSDTEIDATQLGPACPQVEGGTYSGDEDCLHANVWAPAAPAAPRPVMVWIHGGGNSIGSAVYPVYDGRRLAETGDVIVVTVNYRLGQLGFLGHASFGEGAGVYGLLDQIAALEWVRDNIAAFGGDPNNVTIFGESAGGRDVCSLYASPRAKGLFHRAIVQSGSCGALPSRAASEKTANDVVTAAGCNTATDVLACMRALPAETLIRTLASNVSGLESGAYQPMIDGVVQTAQPIDVIAAGNHSQVPFIVGANADETANSAPMIQTEAQYEALVRSQLPPAIADMALARYPAASFPTPRAAYVRLTTDARFVCPSREIARAADSGQAAPVYRYFFQYRPTVLGTPHGLDVVYLFGTFDSVVTQNGPYTPTATDLSVSAMFQGYWSRFAKTGDPAGTPAWPLYAGATDTTLVLDGAASTANGIRTANCDFWAQF